MLERGAPNPHLDAIRAVAAVAVLAMHARALFFVDASAVPHLGPLGRAAYFATSLGHPAVIIFFVLSGFLVGGSVIRALQSGRWSWSVYAVHRASRLYVVLLPALALTAFWDALGIAIAGTTGNFYGGDVHGASLAIVDVRTACSLRALLGNIAFLQTIRVPCFGTNLPLWSLSNEAWYYLAFPLVLCSFAGGSWLRRAICATSFAAVSLFLPSSFREGFVIWMLGAFVAYLTQRSWVPSKGVRILRLVSGVAFLVALALDRPAIALPVSGDLLLGAAFTLYLWTLLGRTAAAPPSGAYARVAHRVSEMSYTLYLTHFPLLTVGQALFVHGTRWQPTIGSCGVGLGFAAIAFAFAAALARVTEAHTAVVRNRLLSVVVPPRVAVDQP